MIHTNQEQELIAGSIPYYRSETIKAALALFKQQNITAIEQYDSNDRKNFVAQLTKELAEKELSQQEMLDVINQRFQVFKATHHKKVLKESQYATLNSNSNNNTTLNKTITIKDILNEISQQIKKLSPYKKQEQLDKFNEEIKIAFAISQLDISQYTRESIIDAILQAALVGIVPKRDSAHAYFKSHYSKKNICQYTIGYLGLIELAVRSKVVKSITSGVVYPHDIFEYCDGTNPQLTHTKKQRNENDEMTHAWAVAKLPDNEIQLEVMILCEINKHKDCSSSHKSCQNRGQRSTWDKYKDEMAKKTVIRKLLKMIPVIDQTTETKAFQTAIHSDEYQEEDCSFPASKYIAALE